MRESPVSPDRAREQRGSRGRLDRASYRLKKRGAFALSDACSARKESSRVIRPVSARRELESALLADGLPADGSLTSCALVTLFALVSISATGIFAKDSINRKRHWTNGRHVNFSPAKE